MGWFITQTLSFTQHESIITRFEILWFTVIIRLSWNKKQTKRNTWTKLSFPQCFKSQMLLFECKLRHNLSCPEALHIMNSAQLCLALGWCSCISPVASCTLMWLCFVLIRLITKNRCLHNFSDYSVRGLACVQAADQQHVVKENVMHKRLGWIFNIFSTQA